MSSTIDKFRAQWLQYHKSPQQQIQPLNQRHKQSPNEKKPQRLRQTKGDFHYDCPHCSEPIFYNRYWFDDFQNRYIPLSAFTHRPHKCYHKEAEKRYGLMNGTYAVSLPDV